MYTTIVDPPPSFPRPGHLRPGEREREEEDAEEEEEGEGEGGSEER